MFKIISNIIGFFSDLFNAVDSLFSYLGKKQELLNSPEMIKNKQDIQEQKMEDKVNQDLKENNVEELGKDISM